MGALSVEASGLRNLLERLKTYKVLAWTGTSSDPDQATDRKLAPLEQADVVSSEWLSGGRHMVALDIDHPCYLVRSSTPGHFHLYIDVPGGIEWPAYEYLLVALTRAGIIEKGYHQASLERRATMVRLPWVKKEPTPALVPVPVSNPSPWKADDEDDEDFFDGERWVF